MSVINLPYKLQLRDYQQIAWDIVIADDFYRGVQVWLRRNGKDLVDWNIMIAKAMQKVGLYYYMAPYYKQARQIIWEGVDNEGRKFLDYIPSEMLDNLPNKGRSKLEMRQDLPNGSQIKLVGSDEIDAVVGTNPRGIVFTEFSLHKRGAWDYLRPILAENGGWALFNGTPRGQSNEMFELYTQALEPDSGWFLQHLTRDDTGHPTIEAIEKDRKSGMPESLVRQEYYCDFIAGNVGTYYSIEMNMLRMDGRVREVPYNPRHPVYTFWDIGRRDATAITFVQFYDGLVHVIDYWESEHDDERNMISQIKIIRELPYAYGDHYAPHDIVVEEYTTGVARIDVASDHGIDFEKTPKLPIQDGIEAVRSIFPRCVFDERKTEKLRKALKHYHKSFDVRTQTYSDLPIKSWANHGADSFRYMAVMADSIAGFNSWENTRQSIYSPYRGQSYTGGATYVTPQEMYNLTHGMYAEENNMPIRQFENYGSHSTFRERGKGVKHGQQKPRVIRSFGG